MHLFKHYINVVYSNMTMKNALRLIFMFLKLVFILQLKIGSGMTTHICDNYLKYILFRLLYIKNI